MNIKLTQYFNNFLTLLKIGESGGSMLFNGSAVAPAVAGGFVSKLYFCDDIIFPATNPIWCELESNPDGTFVANHTLVSSAVYQMFSTHGYVTGPLGVTTLPGGEWSLDIYSAIASGSGQIQVNLYKVAADGSHGAAFATFETAVFSNTALAINRATKFVNSQAGWLATDRVGITILGKKISGGGTPIMTFSHDKLGGTMSTVTSPISLLHDQMFGLNAGDYQHLTPLEKASTSEGCTDLNAANGSTMTLNLALGRNFKIDASGFTGGAYTIAIANQPVGNVTAITLIVTTGAATLPTVTWPSGAAYTLTASKTHILTLVTINGTSWHVLEAKVF